MGKLNPTNPADVTPPPPWERDEFHFSEVPAFVKWKFNYSVSPHTVHSWIKKGRKMQAEGAERGYLPSHLIGKRVFVKRIDVEAFLRAT